MAPVYSGMPVLVDQSCDAWTDPTITPEQQQMIETTAVSVLWALSGRQFGTEVLTVRPVMPRPARPTNRLARPRIWVTGINDYRAVIDLPGPIEEITEVMQDGDVVDPDAYQVHKGRYLVRTDGKVWPVHQSITTPITGKNTFQVSYVRGRYWPDAAAIAAGLLCCELARAHLRDPDCQLPDNVRSIVREGISIDFSSPNEFFPNGMTGIPDVDLWLASVNPDGLTQTSRVWTPDATEFWYV